MAGVAPLGSGVLLLSNSSLVELKVFFISKELVILFSKLLLIVEAVLAWVLVLGSSWITVLLDLLSELFWIILILESSSKENEEMQSPAIGVSLVNPYIHLHHIQNHF